MHPREPTRTNQPGQCPLPHPPGSEGPAEEPAAPDKARARLVHELRQHGYPLSPSVLAAFARVPRHVFVPEIGAAAAYRDEAFVIKCGPDGLPVSSSSQPAMMAIMLDQLGLEPGHRVLEIGTGTGYNAAVMSAVVGPAGEVVSIDIDPELAARARSSLLSAGPGRVTVKCADGGYGDPPGAPFDRIIVTAGAWDIAPAWLGQLGPSGRLVLPLSVRGVQLSVGLEPATCGWHSTSAWRCGFVRMLGAFAGPEEVVRTGEPRSLVFQVSDGSPLDVGALLAALSGEAVDEPAPVSVGSITDLSDLDLWLTIAAGTLDRVTVLAAPGGWLTVTPPPFGALVSDSTTASEIGIAVLLQVNHSEIRGQRGGVVVRGLGPGGPELAARLAGLAGQWAERGRPGAQELELEVWAAGAAPAGGLAGRLVLDRPSVTIAVGWPVSSP